MLLFLYEDILNLDGVKEKYFPICKNMIINCHYIINRELL